MGHPASMSIHEENTYSTVVPMMGVFNNLVIYKQDEPQNSLKSIVPDLATRWSWSEDGTQLTFALRREVKWHDGTPFTAKDVQCTWDMLLGKSQEKLRTNPRASWYHNLDRVTVDGDYAATFYLKRPQPSFIAFLGHSRDPVLFHPCRQPRVRTSRPARPGSRGAGPRGGDVAGD